MLHAPIPVRFALDTEKRMPHGAGFLIASSGSAVMWGAIYAAFALCF